MSCFKLMYRILQLNEKIKPSYLFCTHNITYIVLHTHSQATKKALERLPLDGLLPPQMTHVAKDTRCKCLEKSSK